MGAYQQSIDLARFVSSGGKVDKYEDAAGYDYVETSEAWKSYRSVSASRLAARTGPVATARRWAFIGGWNRMSSRTSRPPTSCRLRDPGPLPLTSLTRQNRLPKRRPPKFSPTSVCGTPSIWARSSSGSWSTPLPAKHFFAWARREDLVAQPLDDTGELREVQERSRESCASQLVITDPPGPPLPADVADMARALHRTGEE